MKDELGNRIKNNYENITRTYLPKKTYVIIRIDGKAFHSYTKNLKQPFDDELVEDMNKTAQSLCKEIQGAKFAYVQSDEISILLTDIENINTQMWFDGNIQKMVSVSASIATARFNKLRFLRCMGEEDIPELQDTLIQQKYFPNLAYFDSRVFTIPQKIEVENYFIWRQQDATRNSISSVAQSLYSHKELYGKSTNEMQEMIFQKGVNWNDYDEGLKRGRLIVKNFINNNGVERSEWITKNPPIFTQEREIFKKLVP